MKRTILIVLVISLLVLSGCRGGLSGLVGSDVATDEEFQQGVGELDYGFLKDAPPKEMRENQIYDAVVQIKNNGASNIETGYISLITEEEFLRVVGLQQQRFDLEGQNKFNPVGEEQTIRFTLETSDLPRQSQRLETIVLSNVCYDYETELNEVVCLHPDPFSQSLDKDVCQPENIRSSGQGAPIAITEVKMIIPNDGSAYMYPIFNIHIKNKKKGTPIVQARTRDLCTNTALSPGELNTMTVYATLGERQLECEDFFVQLKEGEATIRCEDTIGVPRADGPYLTPLYVRLGYGYSETINQGVVITR